jgi:cob(I)alamin adenosyltransferase
MSITTKQGDLGKTKNAKGVTVSKASKSIEAIGAVDELQAWLIYITNIIPQYYAKSLRNIPDVLTILMASLSKNSEFTHGTKSLEDEIEALENETKFKLQGFVVHCAEKSLQINIARTVCRRAERAVVAYAESFDSEQVRFNSAIAYLNRLSDFLFILMAKLQECDAIS